MQRQSTAICSYAPPFGQESFVGQMKIGRTADYQIKSLCWDAGMKHLAMVGMTYQITLASVNAQMCQEVPSTSKLKSSEAWQTSSPPD